jgi:2-dehydro-3-deoxygluconokinase
MNVEKRTPPGETPFDLMGLGEPLLEFNQTRGEGKAYLQDFGGDTSNCMIAAARVGARTAYVTRIGDDVFGRSFLDLWRREGVDVQGVTVDPAAPTGLYFVSHSEAGHAFSYLRRDSAASRMRAEALPSSLLTKTRVLHVSGISQAISVEACDAVFAAIDLARAAGVHIAYDPNLRLKLWPLARARAIIRATIALCDWLMPSMDELAELSGLDEPHAALDWCHGLGAPLVALKCGHRGAWISTGGQRTHIAGHVVASVDATGAGDCFDGVLMARMLAGDAPLIAARFANAAAALKTMGYGAVTPLPRQEAITAFLEGCDPTSRTAA